MAMNIEALLRDLASQQKSMFDIAGSAAGRHAIKDESTLDRWMKTVGTEQIAESGRKIKRGIKQQKSGLKGAALGYILPMVAKKIFPQLQMADWAWKATQAALAYGGYKKGASQVPYNYRGISAEGPQTTFGKPKYKDIASDIERINIQGKTMEALHTAAGEDMAQKLGMYLMPWSDIAGMAIPEGSSIRQLLSTLWPADSPPPFAAGAGATPSPSAAGAGPLGYGYEMRQSPTSGSWFPYIPMVNR